MQEAAAVVALAKPADDPCVPIPGYRHTLLVLTGGGADTSPAWDANALEAAVGKVVWPLGITWYRGSEAASLGEVCRAHVKSMRGNKSTQAIGWLTKRNVSD